MKSATVLLCAFLSMSYCNAAATAPLPVLGTFIYSDACETEGGDFGGFRITVTRGSVDTRVTIEFNDEGPDGRDTARNVKFDPASGKLSFTFHGGNWGKYSFQGIASRDELKGIFDGYDQQPTSSFLHENITLPAIKKVPRALPYCK